MVICKIFLCGSCNLQALLFCIPVAEEVGPLCEAFKKDQVALIPASPYRNWQAFELADTLGILPRLQRRCTFILSFLTMLWANKISQDPVLFLEGEFLQKMRSSPGAPLEGASTIHIYIRIHTHMLLVWAAHIHARQLLFH